MFPLLLCTGFSQSEHYAGKDNFFEKLKAYELAWNMPAAFNKRSIDSSLHVKYDYAISDAANQLEVRYKIIPIKGDIKGSSGKEVKVTNQELIFKSTVAAFVKDIAGSNARFPYQPLPTASVSRDFNADAGGQVLAKSSGTDFGKGYKNIYVVSFYKHDKAIVLISYLFNDLDKAKLNALVTQTYKAVSFKK